MRTSQYMLSTLRKTPTNDEINSYKLMLRAGMIRKLASGLYTWLPTGLRVLKKVENIIREEMNNIGAMEISMPVMQPIKLWQDSGRLENYNQELLRFFDRSKHLFVLSPTNEEIITYIIRNELNSYKQLPLNFFQIRTKFRDELRPRLGVLRSKEFLMKDAYSFHDSQESLQETYNTMYETYSKIFTRMSLSFRVIQADTGYIGGNMSHEFQALAKNGEDNLITSDSSNYAASIKLAEAIAPAVSRATAMEEMKLIDTPNNKNITELCEKFKLPIEKTVKIFLVKAVTTKENTCPLIALLIRGDHELNKTKVEKLPQVANPLTFATVEEVRTVIDVHPNFLGPVNIPIPIIIDHAVAVMSDFAAGANINGKYFFGINWDRDVVTPPVADIRNAMTGDPSPDGKGTLLLQSGIEVGHIFQLGTKYSRLMDFSIQSKNGHDQVLNMGCYGIGITRTVAAIIEQNHDEHGIIWPDNIAPFQIVLLPINMYKSCRVQKLAIKLYTRLYKHNIDVLIDDRKEHPGIMFTDMELIGIPHIVIISDRNLNNNNIEYRYRRSGKKKIIKVSMVFDFLIKTIKG